MPFIHIRSLPFEEPLGIPEIVEGISKDFSKAVGVAPEHVTATWEFFLPGHYANAGVAVQRQPAKTHPVLVDLLAPDFNSPADVEEMLRAVAASISKRAEVPGKNIFINFRQAHAGMVLDAGEVVRW